MKFFPGLWVVVGGEGINPAGGGGVLGRTELIAVRWVYFKKGIKGRNQYSDSNFNISA